MNHGYLILIIVNSFVIIYKVAIFNFTVSLYFIGGNFEIKQLSC